MLNRTLTHYRQLFRFRFKTSWTPTPEQVCVFTVQSDWRPSSATSAEATCASAVTVTAMAKRHASAAGTATSVNSTTSTLTSWPGPT